MGAIRNQRIRLVIMLGLTIMFIFAFAYTYQEEAFASTDYPIIKNEGLNANLNKKYSFKSPNYSNDYTGDTTKYAYIYRNGKKYVKFKLPESRRMTCIGKYNGKYYFNVENGYKAIGVYTYKIGSKKFKKVCKNMNFERFKKSYIKHPYHSQHSGIINKRYILARKNFPTDGYDGFGDAYVYDLKKNKKTSIGSARDIIAIGKKIYWTTTVPYDWASSENRTIVVKSSSDSGKDIITIKEIPFGHINASTGSAFIDSHYVKWNFTTLNGVETIIEQYR